MSEAPTTTASVALTSSPTSKIKIVAITEAFLIVALILVVLGEIIYYGSRQTSSTAAQKSAPGNSPADSQETYQNPFDPAQGQPFDTTIAQPLDVNTAPVSQNTPSQGTNSNANYQNPFTLPLQ